MEDYKKKYEETIEKVKSLLNKSREYGINIIQIQDLEDAIPEIVESEDERIKNIIRKTLKLYNEGIVMNSLPLNDYLDAISWLEKKGETFTKKDVDDAYLKGVCDTKQELEKQGEQKPAEWTPMDEQRVENLLALIEGHGYPGEVAWLNSLKDRVQPKQEWSEDDEYYRNIIMYCLNGECVGNADKENAVLWLKSLKDKVGCEANFTTTKEWSEEDDQFLLVCKNALAKYQVSHKWDATIISRWLEDKLKSLRSQNRWKPTEEQLHALFEAHSQMSAKYHMPLITLYYDIKKLTE